MSKGFSMNEKVCGKCEPYETYYIDKCTEKEEKNCLYTRPTMWDNKFGLVEDTTAVIDGVGKEAEIVTNEKGGKQSKSPMALHLVDPQFLSLFAREQATILKYVDSSGDVVCDEPDTLSYYSAIEYIATFMKKGEESYLKYALDSLEESDLQQVIRISKVLQYGADRYKANNWRLIPQEEHINHALVHIVSHIAGDRQDDHIDHALCRLMMALSTKKSEKFEYGAYVE